MKRYWPAALVLIALGCGPREPVPVPVSGKVSVDGKPLAEGKIFFVTLGKAPEIIDIVDGEFNGKALPGQREVQIAAYRPFQIPPDVPKSMHALMKDGKENYLPFRYHRESILSATVLENGANEFTFDLVTP